MGKGGDNRKGGVIPISATSTGVPPSTIIDSKSGKTNIIGSSNDSTSDTAATTTARPWYIRGGFHVNVFGMGMNVALPPIILIMTASASSLHAIYTPTQIFVVALVLHILLSAMVGIRTFFCLVPVPLYLTTLLIVPLTFETTTTSSSVEVLLTIGLAFFIAIWRIGICMSVCLHRYASHAAFKCGPATRLFLNIVGCLANQGGPIWWSSQHRCHHKHCDMPRDPHSPIQHGVEKAFAFFSVGYDAVEEEFAPKHNDTWVLRLLDTFAFSVCSLELAMSYYLFGREGLFVSYTSMWICQTGSLWFNITNHPPGEHPEKACQASNGKGKATGYYPAFYFLDFICPFFSGLASEAAHADHHVHFMLAKRDKYDVMYYTFVWPMELLGLIWDVKSSPPE